MAFFKLNAGKTAPVGKPKASTKASTKALIKHTDQPAAAEADGEFVRF